MNILEATEFAIALSIRRFVAWVFLLLLILGAYWYGGDSDPDSYTAPITENFNERS